MAQLDLRLIPVTPFSQNCSLLYDTETMEGVMIDPGGEADKLKAALEKFGVTLKEIWLTHGHLDHAGGADELREELGVEVIGPHKDDQFWMDDIEMHWANYGHAGMGRNVVPDRYLEDGDKLELAGVTFDVTHTPGHTPGHVVIHNQDMKLAFVGDVIFRGSIGRTDFPKGNHQDLLDSITQKLWPLGDDMRFVPGHGPMSTFGQERKDNAFVADDVIGTTAPNSSGVRLGVSAPLPYFSLSDLDGRARDIFRDIVESYLETGVPVGSKTLALSGGQSLSPATIRNTMSDLAGYGLLEAPHISAGKIPTQAGLRLFVDGLLEIGDLSVRERNSLEARLSADDRSFDTVLEQASGMLAGLAGGAGLVLTPSTKDAQAQPLKHVEFVAMDDGQALVVLVYADGRVENRIMPRPQGLLPSSLERAGNFLSNRLKGRRLDEARADILREMAEGRAQIDAAASVLIKKGLAEWSGAPKSDTNRSLIVRGQARLLDNLQAQTDLERIRMLFEDLERKEELIALLDRTETADGVKIFIGTENPLFSLSGSSVVIAPYHDAQQNIIGALGVIGPTRLNYARVIPMVDYTAQLIGRWLDR